MPIVVKYDAVGPLMNVADQVGQFKGNQALDSSRQNWTQIGNQASQFQQSLAAQERAREASQAEQQSRDVYQQTHDAAQLQWDRQQTQMNNDAQMERARLATDAAVGRNADTNATRRYTTDVNGNVRLTAQQMRDDASLNRLNVVQGGLNDRQNNDFTFRAGDREDRQDHSFDLQQRGFDNAQSMQDQRLGATSQREAARSIAAQHGRDELARFNTQDDTFAATTQALRSQQLASQRALNAAYAAPARDPAVIRRLNGNLLDLQSQIEQNVGAHATFIQGWQAAGAVAPQSTTQPAPAASAMPLQTGADGLPQVLNEQQYATIPRGTRYVAPDGSVRTKP